MKRRVLLSTLLTVAVVYHTAIMFSTVEDNSEWKLPTKAFDVEADEDDDDDSLHQWNKIAPWSEEKAAVHQKLLEKYTQPFGRMTRSISNYADGAIIGEWKNRGAYNMPGAFKFAEMLDGTDTIYGVTHNHYAGEYNSKSYIFKGTVYNPKTGTKGDDFVRLTGHWPNRYNDLVVIKYNNSTRLIAGIENGPIYYSDDDGQTWNLSAGLPGVLKSTIANRQESNALYTTDGTTVYKSTNGGESFEELQGFGTAESSVLYSPRYADQSDAGNVYLARGGSFYTLTNGGTSFVLNGSYGSTSGKSLSIGGDSRKLYVTANSSYWSSTNGGTSWTQKYPKGNWYGSRTGTMSAGKYLCVSPAGPDTVIGGYAQPVFSRDGLNSDISTDAGWGRYQNGTNLGASAYYDRIRFNYHPDFQASHFFYNSTNDLMSVHCTDGGLFVSYKVWQTASETNAYDNGGYTTADFINITTLGTTCPLIYRNNLFTGELDETHIIYSTQDQGTQSIIPGTSGESLDFYQSIGGDGPPLNSADGRHVWKWSRQGNKVWAPVDMYDASGNMRSAGVINGMFNSSIDVDRADTTYENGVEKVTWHYRTNFGWCQTYIDHDAPDSRMWLLGKTLKRVEWDGTSLSKLVENENVGYYTHEIAAITQGWTNPDILWILHEGKVRKSTNRGDTFGSGVTTPFSLTSNKQNYGGGWVLPTNDNWILFCGPSSNSVGAILSKDGGATWVDVTGSFPSGDDFQIAGVTGTPDGKYVFAGTDIGPWVFVVATETWYPIGEGAAYFNTTAVEYIESTNTVRFGTWGSGVWDFTIQDGTIDPFVTLIAPNGGEKISRGETVAVSWKGFYDGHVSIELLKGGTVVKTIAEVQKGINSFSWQVGSDIAFGEDYTIKVSSAGSAVSDVSDENFAIVSSYVNLISPDSEAVLRAGGVAEISWKSNLNGSLQIELYKSGTLVDTIVVAAAATGTYSWSVDSAYASDDSYSIKLTAVDDKSVTDSSAASFFIKEFLLLEQSHLSVNDVDSEHSSLRNADNTIDNDPSTLWHTEWSPNLPDFPHYITYAIDTSVELVAFSYLPRQDGSANGRIKDFTVDVSEDDGVSWQEVKAGSLPNVSGETVVTFDRALSGTLVRFTGLSEQNGDAYASMAEFNLYYVHREDNGTVGLDAQSVALNRLTVTGITQGRLNVQVPKSGQYEIKLISMNGRIIHNQKVDLALGRNAVSLKHLNLGQQISVLQIEGAGYRLQEKISLR